MTQPAVQAPDSLFRRIRHTPLRDVLRLRLTGRLDYRARVAASGLPVEAQAMILRVVRQTRLRKLEKAGVADELIAHFADGLDAGAPADEMLANFGDERTAARLIRRAKIRNRSLAWQAFRVARWGFAGVVALYLLSAAVFFVGKPSPKVDYVEALNRQAPAAAEADRAWPLYARAMATMAGAVTPAGQVDREALKAYRTEGKNRELNHLLDALPGDPEWPKVVAMLDRHRDALALVREAAARPALGFRLGRDGDAYDPDVYPEHQPLPEGEPYADLLISVLLPYLNELRGMAKLLALDAAAAREAGDAARLRADIDAMLGIARHADHGGILISNLVSIGITALAMDEVERSLVQAPGLLPDTDLRALAHRIGGPKVAAEIVSLRGERMFFEDLLQHIYTDNGRGDGRITPQGLRTISTIGDLGGSSRTRAVDDEVVMYAVVPAAMPFLASRKELADKQDSLMAICEANMARPMREADWARLDRQVKTLTESSVQKVRYLPVALLFPAISRVQETAERSLARREAVVTAIALELYRRQNGGAYPERLEALVPRFLPEVPRDRIDGAPMRYGIAEGRPVLYSVGVDRDDDGGKVYVNPNGDIDARAPADWPPEVEATSLRREIVDADWVLFPEPRPPHRPPSENPPMEPG